MILRLDSADGIIKIGSPPVELPGIVESIRVQTSLLMKEVETQCRSGKVKEVQGWDDAAISITLTLIDDPGTRTTPLDRITPVVGALLNRIKPPVGKTRWDALRQITNVFKKVDDEGKPKVYILCHPMINAWGSRRFLFTSLESSENRTMRAISVSLEFAEYDNAVGIIQDRKADTATDIRPAVPTSPPVSAQQRQAAGTLGVRLG